MAKQGLVLAFSLGTTVMAGMVQGAPMNTEATAPIELRAAGSWQFKGGDERYYCGLPSEIPS